MSISSVGMSNDMARMATDIQGEKYQGQITTSVLKEIQDMQKAMGNALVKMIEESGPTPQGTGQIINRRA
jgi:hypothetical protein